MDSVASIDEGEPVVKTLSKGCAASVRLALGRVAGPINVRVVARNSVGTSAVLELAADVPPPVEADAFDAAALAQRGAAYGARARLAVHDPCCLSVGCWHLTCSRLLFPVTPVLL